MMQEHTQCTTVREKSCAVDPEGVRVNGVSRGIVLEDDGEVELPAT
jgi:hypothetical protein